MAGPEQKIQKKIVEYLESVGCKVIKLVAANKKGNADLIVCYRGLYIEIEVKQPGKKPTKLQLLKGQETVEAGGFWMWADNLEDVKTTIDSLSI